MAQESKILEINLDEFLNETLMKDHSCKLLQLNNKKLNKQIKKMMVNFDEETILNDINNKVHEQNSKRVHSSVAIRERLQRKLKEKK